MYFISQWKKTLMLCTIIKYLSLPTDKLNQSLVFKSELPQTLDLECVKTYRKKMILEHFKIIVLHCLKLNNFSF